MPIIYVLNNCGKKQKQHLKRFIKKNDKNYEIIENIYKIIKEEGGLIYTENKIKKLKEKTFSLIEKLSLNNKQEIQNILNSVINRNI